MGTHIFPGRGPCHQVPLPEAPYKVDVFLAAVFERHTGVRSLTVPSSSSKSTSTDYWAVVQVYFVRRFATGTRFPGVRLLALAVLRKYPWPLRRSRGDGNGRPLIAFLFTAQHVRSG